MLILAIGIGQPYFQFELLLLIEYGFDDPIPNGRDGLRATIDQLLPGTVP